MICSPTGFGLSIPGGRSVPERRWDTNRSQSRRLSEDGSRSPPKHAMNNANRAPVVLLLLDALRGRHFPDIDVKQLGERRLGQLPEASGAELGRELLGL